jgi:hypothetical protein
MLRYGILIPLIVVGWFVLGVKYKSGVAIVTDLTFVVGVLMGYGRGEAMAITRWKLTEAANILRQLRG